MTNNPVQSNPINLSAFSISELPDLKDFYIKFDNYLDIQDAETLFDHSLFKQNQISASQVDELRDLVYDFGMPDYPIVFCQLQDMCGCVYLEGDTLWPIMFLDSIRANSLETLREVYIHEAAHLTSEGQDHDFGFAVAHNTFRLKAGLTSSELEYDYRACLDDMSFAEAKNLSIQFARIVIDANIHETMITELTRYIPHLFRGYQGPDDADKILASFTNIVKSIDNTNDHNRI